MNNDKQLIATETLKRTRTSPRLLVIKEVQALIQAEVAALPTISDEHMRQTIHNLLTSLSAQVEKLLEGHPKKEKSPKSEEDADSSTKGPKGTHFVGQNGEGNLFYLRRDKEGVYHTSNGSTETILHVWGPFNTRAGCEYAITHNTYTQHPQVM